MLKKERNEYPRIFDRSSFDIPFLLVLLLRPAIVSLQN